MRPTLVTWRAVRIPSYVAMLYLGLLAGTYSAYAAVVPTGCRANGSWWRSSRSSCRPCSARVLHSSRAGWSAYRAQPLRILLPGNEGGAVAYGALLSVPVSVPLLVALGLPFASFWDAGAFGFLAAIVCLRIGCFLNGCCSGLVAKRIPTQLLEAGWAALLLVAAILAAGSMPFAGALFLATLAAYAAGRFFIDFARDAPRTGRGLTVAQTYSAGFVLLSAVFLSIASWAW